MSPANPALPRTAGQVEGHAPAQNTDRWERHNETIHAITDLTYAQIRTNRPADSIRGQWATENRLPWIRDIVFQKTSPRSEPDTPPPSQPPRETSPSASTGGPEAADIAAAVRSML